MRAPLRPTLLLVTFAAQAPWPSSAHRAAVARVAAWDEEGFDLKIVHQVIPRTYVAADDAVATLRRLRPQLALVLDTDATSPEYKLHVFGANYDDDPRPDVAGVVKHDAIIDPDAPVAFRTRLPLDGLWDKLLVERVPVRMSHKAGGHVFNHVLFRLLQAAHDDALPTRVGAVETPALASDKARDVEARTEAEMAEELVMVVAVLRRLLPSAGPEAGAPAG